LYYSWFLFSFLKEFFLKGYFLFPLDIP
jgi:hypothetical protein